MRSASLSRRPLLPLALAALLALAPAGCGGGGGGGACTEGLASLEILDPVDDQAITADSYAIVVQTCGIAEDEMIVLRLLQPFETDYAFVTVPTPDARVTADVPLLPGTMEFVAATRDGSIQSASVTIEASRASR